MRAEAAKVVETALYPMVDYLEKEPGDRMFFVGGALSIANIAVASRHVNLRRGDVEPAAARGPRLAACLRRMRARPSGAALLAEETRL